MTTVNIDREPKTLRVVVNAISKTDRGGLFTFLIGVDTQGFVPVDLLDQLKDDLQDEYIPFSEFGTDYAPGVYLLTVLYEWDEGDWSVGIGEGWELVDITSTEPLSLTDAHEEGEYES